MGQRRGNLDTDRIHQVLDHAPHARIAVGTTARGIDGFRRSHRDALATQRMLARLRSQQRLAFFADIHMIAVLTENPDSAADFITSTLGDLESASPQLLTTVLTYINEQCNASRAAHVLHTHRNTLLRRLETAQRLLPRPLDHDHPGRRGHQRPPMARQSDQRPRGNPRRRDY